MSAIKEKIRVLAQEKNMLNVENSNSSKVIGILKCSDNEECIDPILNLLANLVNANHVSSEQACEWIIQMEKE